RSPSRSRFHAAHRPPLPPPRPRRGSSPSEGFAETRQAGLLLFRSDRFATVRARSTLEPFFGASKQRTPSGRALLRRHSPLGARDCRPVTPEVAGPSPVAPVRTPHSALYYAGLRSVSPRLAAASDIRRS